MFFGFSDYKRQERGDKRQVVQKLQEGLSLREALEEVFNDLNKHFDLGLGNNTVQEVAKVIADLEGKMDLENVIEIYSSFIYWCIFDGGKFGFGKEEKRSNYKFRDESVLYAVNNLSLRESGGYYALRADSDPEELSRKRPERI